VVGLWTLLAKQFYVMQRGKVLSLDVGFDVVLMASCIAPMCVMLVILLNSLVCFVEFLEKHPWNLNDSMFELI
jgi:hypothetical protein